MILNFIISTFILFSFFISAIKVFDELNCVNTSFHRKVNKGLNQFTNNTYRLPQLPNRCYFKTKVELNLKGNVSNE